jgi:hypothetical protein
VTPWCVPSESVVPSEWSASRPSGARGVVRTLGVRVRLPLCRGGVQLVVVRSGSFGLPRLLLDLSGFPGSSRSSVRRRRVVAHRPALSVFASPSVPSSRAGWSSQPSSLEIHRPSVDIPSSVHSRSRSEDRLHRPPVATPEVPFRPRGFAPPRRLAPLGARGLVASRCRPWGSPRFRSIACPAPPKQLVACWGPSPRRTHPGELLLVDSRTASPRPLSPCRSLSRSQRLLRGFARNLTFPIGALARAPESTLPPLRGDCQGRFDFETLLRRRVCSVFGTIAGPGTPCPPWASGPLQGASRRSDALERARVAADAPPKRCASDSVPRPSPGLAGGRCLPCGASRRATSTTRRPWSEPTPP